MTPEQIEVAAKKYLELMIEAGYKIALKDAVRDIQNIQKTLAYSSIIFAFTQKE